MTDEAAACFLGPLKSKRETGQKFRVRPVALQQPQQSEITPFVSSFRLSGIFFFELSEIKQSERNKDLNS